MDKTKTLSVHVRRSNARARERKLQALLDQPAYGTRALSLKYAAISAEGIPDWAKGVRVESAVGGLMHTVVATEWRGR